jgi:hypothetical protein
MITTILITIFIGFASTIIWFLSLFGSATLPAEIPESLIQFANAYSVMNNIFPIPTILQIIATQVIIEISIYTYKTIKWTYTKIPTIN